MAVESAISWTHATFNPIRSCVEVSPACDHCYARELAKRNPKILGTWGSVENGGTRVVAAEKYWQEPIKWNRQAAAEGVRKRVFCESLGDVFEDWQGPMSDHTGKSLYQNIGKWGTVDELHHEELINHPVTMQDVRTRLFHLIDSTPWLDWLLLTKRPENIVRMWTPYTTIYPNHRSNVWLGTTVENQKYADSRIPELLKCRSLSPVLFLSCEPLLGPVDLRPALWLEDQYFHLRRPENRNADRGLDWVICGGESGPNARPSHPGWFADLRSQCGAAQIPFHFKQWGEYVPGDHDCVTFGDDMKTVLPWHAEKGSDITPMVRVGVKRAGRLLDGILHDAFPEVAVQ